MKKKILALCLVVVLAVTAVTGATLAYFTDVDSKDNVFTVGDLDITLDEVFPENPVLQPGSKTQNAINKDVWVTNHGDNDAWVRVKVYIPSALDQLTTPQYTEEGHLVAAAFNTVHFNTKAGSETIWNINKANVEAKAITEGKYAGYNEYIFYYNEILPAGQKTAQLLDQVYLDGKVNCDKTVTGEGDEAVTTYYWYKEVNGVKTTINYALENGLTMPVVAEAIQAEGFDNYADAFAAYDAQK